MGTSARLSGLSFATPNPSNFMHIVGHAKPSAPARAPSELAGNALPTILAVATVIILIGAVTLVGSPHPDSTTSRSFQQAVAHALDENAPIARGRLVSATLIDGADATVEFVLRDDGDAPTNRAAALADTLAIARAVYQIPEPHLVDVTVVGLAWRPSAVAFYTPVLYASLPADRLVGRDWSQLRPDDLPSLAGVRWLPTGVCQAWHECGTPIG